LKEMTDLILDLEVIDTTVECANLDCFCKVELVEAISVLEHSWVCSSECLWEWNNQGFVRSEFYD
jgi:hypothetical protein